MSPTPAIRSATTSDEPVVVRLWQECGLTTSYNDPHEDFKRALNKSNSDILVACNNENVIIGSLMVGHDGHRGWIYYVSTHPRFRHQGVARSLITSAEKWLGAHGIPKVMLLVRETNTAVVDFYKKIDFETTPRTILQKWIAPSSTKETNS